MIINKKSIELSKMAKSQHAIYLSIYGKGTIFFTQQAACIFGLKAGKFLHFDNTDNRWSFFQSNDRDGFLIGKGNQSEGSVKIFSPGLAKMIRRSTGHEDNVRFYLMTNGSEKDGFKVVDIITTKTYAEFINM